MIQLQCPICKSEILVTEQQMICSNEHIFLRKNGVYKLMEETSLKKLDSYLEKFEYFRSSKIQKINATNVNDLPFVNFDTEVWKLRVNDLKIITSLLSNQKGLNVLDVGAWNGWLSQNLSRLDHQVIALDCFTASFDGLETVQHYTHKFIAIQSFTEELSIFQSKFDLIIVNRCLPYFSNLKKQIESLKKLLAKNGTLIITGINLTNDPKKVLSHLEKTNTDFKNKYQTSLFIVPFKGYTDKNDIQLLKENGFIIKHYQKNLFKSFLYTLGVLKVKPFYGVYKKSC